MNNEIIIALIGIASTVVGSFTSWFFTRKKYSSEVDSTVIQNMKEALEIYKTLSDDNKVRLEEALTRNTLLEQEVINLRNQVFELMNSICYDLSCAYRSKLPKTTEMVKKVNKTKETKKEVNENN